MVKTAAHLPQHQFSGLVATETFEAWFVSKYKGGTVQVVNGFAAAGNVIRH